MRDKSNIKTWLRVSVFLAAIGCASASGQVIFEDDFESYTNLYGYADLVAAGYTVINGCGQLEGAWRLWNTSGDFLGGEDPAIAGMSGTYVITDSDLAGFVEVDEALITPPIDCTGYADVRLGFSKNYRVYPADISNRQIAEVDIRSSDDGVTFGGWVNLLHYDRTTVAEYDTDPEHVNISQYADGKIIQIRFHYYTAKYDWWFAIDNIRVYVGGLVAHWTLDEGFGSMALDSSGKDNHGTLLGPVWQLDGMIDGALEFDGQDDYVDCGNSASLDITGRITVAAWVKTNDAGNSQHNPYVAKGDHSYALKHYFNNSIEFFIYDADWQAVRFPVDGSFNGVWHHLAGTYDGSDLNLYVDGVLEATTPYVGSIASSSFNVNMARNSEMTDRYYEGLLDDVRIYDCALSQSEIQALVGGPTAALPVVTTLGATDVGPTSAILRALLADDGGDICQIGFRHKKGLASPYTYTASFGSLVTGQSSSLLISGLTPASTYYFNARGTNSAGQGSWGDEQSFTTTGEPPVPGLLAHWKLDESNGDTAEDSAGDNDGTTYGGPVWLPDGGMIGGALAFDGLDDYVSLPIGSLIASLTNSTFATWVDFSNLGGPWQRIFDFGSNRTAYMFLTPRLSTTGQMRFGITVAGGGSPEQLVTAPTTLPSGWHHVAVTIDADINTVNLYLDGVVVASNVAVTLTPSDLGNTANNWLGRSQYSADAYFNGVLDDFRIYDYALSDEQIVKLLCIDPPPGDSNGDCRFDLADLAILFSNWLACTMTDCEESPVAGLVAHYKLDEGAGTIATDASGNGHDGIAQNGEPNWVDGQTGYGRAMQWDGLTPGVGWINCGTWNPSAQTGQLTVATWAKWDGSNGAYQGLIGKRDGWDDQGTNMMWHIEINKNNSAVAFARAGVYPPCGDVVLPVGEWSHVAVTFDGSTMVFYFDGAETGRGDFSFGSKADAAIVFGCVEASGWHGFNGALDDIRLYDYALSANEIDEIVQVSCSEPPAGDSNNDCRFDFADLDIILSDWLTCTLPVQELCGQLTTPEQPVPPAR